MMPLAIDLFCGLGGWTEGLLLEGFRVVGFDIEQHVYGEHRYPAQLVLQDVLTIHGSQFKTADLIVASPPCQEYSYMAMPWSRGRKIAGEYRAGVRDIRTLTALFDACFRIQREASEAAGHHIPLVVENVRGAIPWVGQSRWNFGSFHLWGDVPALMPMTRKAIKVPAFRFDGSGKSFQTASVEGQKMGRAPRVNGVTKRLTNPSEWDGLKNPGVPLSEAGFNVSMAKTLAPTLKGAAYKRTENDKRQHLGINRKAASAMIAKIPLVLSRHIAASWKPERAA